MKNDLLEIQPFGGPVHGNLWEPRRHVGRRAAYAPPGRSLHLVDVENLMGGPHAGSTALAAAVEGYRALARVHLLDHAVIGANPALALAIGDVWPGARLVVGGGHDGADLALIGAASDIAWLSERYDRIVIGSGDGIFTGVAAGFRAAGLDVTVVSRAKSLSMQLAAMASTTLILPAGRESLA